MQLSFLVYNSSGESSFRAGTEIRGKLIMKSGATPVAAQRLSVYFRGKEYSTVTYQEQQSTYNADGTSSYHSVTRTAHDKHQLMRIEIPISAHQQSTIIRNGRTIPGSHEVPFRVQLPANIPSSVSVCDGRDNGKIEYCLRAKLIGSGIMKDYQARKPITVVAASPHSIEQVPCILRPKTQGINCMGLFNKGDISYGARISTKILDAGQTLDVHLALLNHSKENIEFVKIQLIENTGINASGHSANIRNDLYMKNFAGQRIPGCLKPCEEIRKQVKHDPNSRQKSNQQLLRALEDCGSSSGNAGDNGRLFHCRIPVPSETKDTYAGTKINTSHSLRIKIKTRSGVTNPELTIPLTIVPLHGGSTSSQISTPPTTTTPAPVNTVITATKPHQGAPVGIGLGHDNNENGVSRRGGGGVIITSIKPNSIFGGTKLQKGMEILLVNGTDVTNESPGFVVGLLQSITSQVTLVAAAVVTSPTTTVYSQSHWGRADFMNPDGSVVTVTATKRNPSSSVGIGLGHKNNDETTTSRRGGGCGVIITSIKPGSIFLGTSLQTGMKIISVNGTDVTNGSPELVVGLLQSIASDVTLVVSYPTTDMMAVSSPTIPMMALGGADFSMNTHDSVTVTATATKPTQNSPVGIGLGNDETSRGGVIITSIKPTSIFLGTSLQTGMKILQVNGTDVTNGSPSLVVGLLRSISSDVTLVAAYPTPMALEVTATASPISSQAQGGIIPLAIAKPLEEDHLSTRMAPSIFLP